MKKAAFLLWFCLAAPLWAAAPVGQVIDLEGDAWITRKGGQPARAVLQYAVFLEDQIETRASGGVKILFVDDTLLTVKENSKVLITQFLFNPKAKQRSIALEAIFGRLRTIVTRFVGKDQLVEIKTPTAVAGIRGTNLGLMVEAKKTILYCFHCEKQEVQAFNREFPGQTVTLSTKEAIEISAGRAADPSHIVPIPADILNRIDTLFDIRKGAAAESVKQAGESAAKESADEAELSKTAGRAKEDASPVMKDAEIIPGGGDEATTGSTVTITLPQ
ncbi:MAG: FecR domain-containing protein [Deltaproteobacteria bacterium]|nr:FecR domain-containing protein [Deltaproteobacteria bacterium]